MKKADMLAAVVSTTNPVLFGEFMGAVVDSRSGVGDDGKPYSSTACKVALACGSFPAVRVHQVSIMARGKPEVATACHTLCQSFKKGQLVMVELQGWTVAKGVASAFGLGVVPVEG